MLNDTDTPYVAVVATTSDQRPTSVHSLAHAPGLLHPHCTAAPMTTTQRRLRARRARHGWAHFILTHSTCEGCPHHPRNEYGTWLASVLRFHWRAWAGYLYGPVVVAAQWGTRRTVQSDQGSTDLYPFTQYATEYIRHHWDTNQAALPPRQRATHRLEQWHAQRAWQQRAQAVAAITKE